MKAEEILKTMTPEIYRRFRSAIEVGKWPDGRKLSTEQIETCMQAIITYEGRYVAEIERTGYVPPKKKSCDSTKSNNETNTLKWQ
ncbi:YeaC family protein [Teredinibacter haidensis]|uniref:YeaC family protein n=1 Tax=Teredinibacter haidensis TaxID=2731755 RepID=UPI000948D1AD|nr:DUF1315 family protein [Teredinibacter haidensis]